jgi:hypothetical protein
MKRYAAIILLTLSAAALAIGIVQLFLLRFRAGDVYPQYSSLRADPLGTMALYESFEKLPGITVRRDLTTTNQFPGEPGTTYLHLSASLNELESFPEDALREIERFATAGGRIVITAYPVGAKSVLSFRNPKEPQAPKQAAPNRDRWGVDYDLIDLDRQLDEYKPATVVNVSGRPLPETLSWHSGIVLKNLHPDWRPIYSRGPNPVMIERSFGKGSALIATDSYFLSNEAMLFDRHSDLLAFVIGPARSIVFDEAHLGVTENPGMATLVSRYRLWTVAASLIVIAALFIWKMSMPLSPRQAGQGSAIYIAGKDTSAGIINLLRRSVPAGELLKTCFDEWKKSAPQRRAHSITRMRQAEAAFQTEMTMESKRRDDVAAYRNISKILQRQSK